MCAKGFLDSSTACNPDFERQIVIGDQRCTQNMSRNTKRIKRQTLGPGKETVAHGARTSLNQECKQAGKKWQETKSVKDVVSTLDSVCHHSVHKMHSSLAGQAGKCLLVAKEYFVESRRDHYSKAEVFPSGIPLSRLSQPDGRLCHARRLV